MLGTTGAGRSLGPSGSQTHRNLWPTGSSLEFQSNGEVTESLFTAGGFSTPPSNSAFMSAVSPLELVTKNFQSGTAVAFSQANSIFVQSHTDFLSGTAVSTKKTETCYGRWDHGLEPLHIQVPPLPAIASVSFKRDFINPSHTNSVNASTSKYKNFNKKIQNKSNGQNVYKNSLATNIIQSTNSSSDDCQNIISTNNIHHHHHYNSSSSSASSSANNKHSTINDLNSGCSRTIPLSWTTSASSSSTNNFVDSRNIGCSLLQIKREPCQVSEITTSNSLGHSAAGLTAVVKIETHSPRTQQQQQQQQLQQQQQQQQRATMENMQNAGQSVGAIPVGIAVARQRLQEHAQQQQQHQPKEMNRFGIGIAADLGTATSAFSQNMFFTGTNNSTMIPFSSEAVSMGVSNIQNAVRTPPTLWQYPTSAVPVESMLPIPPPSSVGYQLVRDPSTGQLMFLPTTTSLDKLYISYPEPFQQAVVWPSYQQQALQAAPHLLLPPMPQQMQPPPLTPLHLLGQDYLGSTTLHQHTQTHSTRLVALTSEGKRKTSHSNIPLPTLIKIEDCHTTMPSTSAQHHHHPHHQQHHQSSLYEPCKSTAIQTATITTAVQTNDMSPDLGGSHQLYYQSEGNLIQISPHTEPCPSILHSQIESRSITPTITELRCVTPPVEHNIEQDNLESVTAGPEVQDANIQTDTPVMSEDDNTSTGPEDCSSYSQQIINNTADDPVPANVQISSSSYATDLCHNISSISEINSTESSFIHPDINNSQQNQHTDTSFDSNTTVTSSINEDTSISSGVPSHHSLVLPFERTPDDIVDQSCDEPAQADSFTEEITPEIQPQIPQIQPQQIQRINAPDLSGLELLSNSIEAFEKKTFIKQEPPETIEPAVQMYQPDEQSAPQTEPIDCSINSKTSMVDNDDDRLGGLNLLCALAEQRFQEEVGQRSRKRSSSSEGSESKKIKKHHKDKHSNKKSSKKSKHSKDRKDRKSKHQQQSDEDDDESLEKDLQDTFNRVKTTYSQCSCQKNNDDGSSSGCCRKQANWPTPKEVYIAMKTDMRHRLAKMAKEFQEKKRKLEEKTNLLPDPESTPIKKSSFFFNGEASSSKLRTDNISPNLSFSSSQSDNNQPESLKIPSDTESFRFDDVDTNSSSSPAVKRKNEHKAKVDAERLDSLAAAKKSKSLVGFIFASKKRINDAKNENSSTMDEGSQQSDSLPSFNAIKQEVVEDEELSQQELFGCSSSFDKRNGHKSKHQSKHKKSKNKERKHRRSSDYKDPKRQIDSKCTLTSEHLDNLTAHSKPRVLTAMGGLFYAGCLSAIEAPDVYAVTLDGERGNRPHIMSREEILRDAILELAPTSVEEIHPGARLCAYWSQQYRCLYPGTVAQPGTHDFEDDPKYIIVEFDDGDSGRIAIEDIRFLLSDYPIVEYDPNPLLSLGKRKQRASQCSNDLDNVTTTTVESTKNNCFSIQEIDEDIKNENKEAYKERRRLKKIRKDKLKAQDSMDSVDKKHKHKHKCAGEEFCKHRKHKKRRKHKKHHHRDDDTPTQSDEKQKINEIDPQEDSNSLNSDENIESSAVAEVEKQRDEVFHPEFREETMTEEEASSVTESSGSTYQPGAKKDRQNSTDNHSKIAAFLPARQLWAWSGKGIKRSGPKGRGKKQFFKCIQRGKETISVGDSAVFLSTGRPDRPYIGRIESMWETSSNNRVVRVKWYYHPEETTGCPELMYPGGLFQSPHADENDVQTISHKCKVLPLDLYTKKYGPDPKEYSSVYDNNDTFYVAGHYDPTSFVLKIEKDIPAKNSSETTQNTSISSNTSNSTSSSSSSNAASSGDEFLLNKNKGEKK